jgi:hypothetical protein
MIGLMTLWFGPYVEVAPDHGYFYLCPPCYRDRVKPHLEKVQGRLAELHPAAAAFLERERASGRGRSADDAAELPESGEEEGPSARSA